MTRAPINPARSLPGIASLFFGLLIQTASAASLPSDASQPSLRERELAAENFIKEKLWVWQKRLNLDQWAISIRLLRSSALKPKTLGNIHWDSESMTASIAVQAVADYKLPQAAMLDDMEFTVVHELVHLQLSSLPRSEASRRAEEHAVNEITRALLRLAQKQ